MRVNGGSIGLVFVFCATCTALQVTILADANHDGIIDEDDLLNRDQWTHDRGALFLANIGDTDQRCSTQLKHPIWERDAKMDDIIAMEKELDLCNDASDDAQRNPSYLAPVRTLPIKSDDLPDNAAGTIQVVGELAAAMTRVFVRDPGEEGWRYVNATREFTAKEMQHGLELGIDARDVRRPGPDGWNGHAKIQFTISYQGQLLAKDTVALRVAPVLTHHHAQKAQRLFVSNGPHSNPNNQTRPSWGKRGLAQNIFAEELAQHAISNGIKEPTFNFYEAGDPWNMVGDPWVQDFFEPGFTSIPGPNDPITLRVMVRSVQSFRPTGREVFHGLRSEGVGAVQVLGRGSSQDSLGNLETIPPYTFNGTSYPAGRIMMGRAKSAEPLLLDFLRAQEVQDPITLDVSWLAVGHVDEFLQFLPASNRRGWVLMIPDPLAGLDIIRAAAERNGSAPAVSRPPRPYDAEDCFYNETIEYLLAFPNLEAIQESVAAKIQLNLDILKREIGLRDTDIYRVPGLFTNKATGKWRCQKAADTSDLHDNNRFSFGQSYATCPSTEDLVQQDVAQQKVTPGSLYLSFPLYPNAINSLVLTDNVILAAKQWGPIVGGIDVLEEAVVKAYAQVGFQVKFVDDWFTHHDAMGELRCGSNVWREADVEWWK